MNSLANVIRWASASLAPVALMAVAGLLIYHQVPGWGWFLAATFLILIHQAPLAVPVAGKCCDCRDKVKESPESSKHSS